MDTVILALIGGFLLSGFMRYDKSLFKATRCTWFAIGYFVALIGAASVDGCAFFLSFINASASCPTLLTARENFSTHILGVEPANQVSAIMGSVGFVLTTSGTQSKKWLATGVMLGAVFLLMIYRTIFPT